MPCVPFIRRHPVIRQGTLLKSAKSGLQEGALPNLNLWLRRLAPQQKPLVQRTEGDSFPRAGLPCVHR